MKFRKLFLMLIFLTLSVWQYTCNKSINHFDKDKLGSITPQPIIRPDAIISLDELKKYKLVPSSINPGGQGNIRVIENNQGKKFVLKQARKQTPYRQFTIVPEFLACYMTEEAELSCINKAK